MSTEWNENSNCVENTRIDAFIILMQGSNMVIQFVKHDLNQKEEVV